MLMRFYFEQKFIAQKGKVKPEDRLPMSMAGAFCFPVSVFVSHG